jgi:hypothetical protein
MRALLLAVFALCGCSGTGSALFSVQIVDGTGEAPTLGDGTLTVTVLQEGAAAPLLGVAAVRASEFQLDLTIPSYEPISVLHAELEGREPLLGATPPFRPAFSPGGFARLVMGRPGACVLLSAPTLARGLSTPGMALVESNLLVIGGVLDTGVPAGSVSVFVPHQLTDGAYASELDPVSPPLGASRVMRFAGTTSLLVLGEASAVRFETRPITTGARVVPQALHTNAGSGSALADLGARGVAVIGGGGMAEPSSEITIVRAVSAPETLRLAAPRALSSAIAFAGGLLVAGGQAEGLPLFEWFSAGGERTTFGPTERRVRGTLVRSPDGVSALYYLGEDGAGTPEGGWLVRGCPACEASFVPLGTTPRRDALCVPRSTGTLVLGGIARDSETGAPSPQRIVEEVRFEAGGPVLAPLGSLQSARIGATAIALTSDLVLVGGGFTRDGVPVTSFDLCFPERLPAIALP